MNSSGVLAFYLSENENPDLWRAMAQMSQNERAEVFLSALSYFLVGDDEDMYAASADSEEENNAPQTQSLFSVPRAQ
jgi:hypothetical protein